LMDWRKDSMTRTTKGQQVDRWDLISSLGASHTTKQSHRIVIFLSRIRVWSYITSWRDVEVSTTGDVWRG
jgi:hypothetical protein